MRTSRLLLATMMASFVLGGCVTPAHLLAPYADRPSSCEAVEAEMRALAETDARLWSINYVIVGAASGLPVVASAGGVPSGLAWLGLGAPLLNAFRLPTHEQRMAYLGYQHAYLQCPPLRVAEAADSALGGPKS